MQNMAMRISNSGIKEEHPFKKKNFFQLDIYFKKGNSSSFQHERTHNSLTHPPMTCNTERLSFHHTGSLPAHLIDGEFEKIKSVES